MLSIDEKVGGMTYLSTRHDDKELHLLNEELFMEASLKGSTAEIVIQNHGLRRIGRFATSFLAIRKLDISFNMFETLDGIEQFSQLRSLHCYSSRLKEMESLRDLRRLETLMLQQNQIDHVPSFISSFNKLRELRLDHNEIQKIGSALTGCSSLRRLDLSSNRIKSIKGLTGLQNLVDLRLANNAITSIKELRSLPSLVELDCSHNLLHSLEGIEHIPSIQSLNAMHNRLVSLEIPKVQSALHKVNIHEGLIDLVEINISSNRINSLRGLLAIGKSLKKIDVRSNKLDLHEMVKRNEVCFVTGFSLLEELLIEKNQGFTSANSYGEFSNESVEENDILLKRFYEEIKSNCHQLRSVDGQAFVQHDNAVDHSRKFDETHTLITETSGGTKENDNSSRRSDWRENDDGESTNDETTLLLNARVVTEVKSMAELEKMESSIRDVLSSTRDILNSVFLLEDTSDGLYSSVAPDRLPKSTQFAAIAAVSQECNWVPPLSEPESEILSTKGAILIHHPSGVDDARTEILKSESTNDSVEEAAVRMARAPKKVEQTTAAGSNVGRIGNKEFVQDLIDEIKHKVKNEALMSPTHVGGTVGTTTPIGHNRDLPSGSNLTRHGSKIVDTKPSDNRVKKYGVSSDKSQASRSRVDNTTEFDVVWQSHSQSMSEENSTPHNDRNELVDQATHGNKHEYQIEKSAHLFSPGDSSPDLQVPIQKKYAEWLSVSTFKVPSVKSQKSLELEGMILGL